MKIGQISQVYLPHIGGLENYVYRLKQSLENKGNEVTVYTTNFGVRNTNIKEKNVIYCKTNFSLLRNPFSFELMKKLKQSNEDIYHLHGYEFLTSLFATKVLKGKPKVITVHGAKIESGNIKIRLLNKVYYPFGQYVLKNVDMIMSEGERDYLLHQFKLPPNKVVVIPNGIKIADFVPDKNSNEIFTKKYSIKEDSFKILYVCRVIEEKNPKKLISTVTKYMRNENVEVILIGRGPLRYVTELKKMSDNRIHILGEVSSNELVAAYHVSDLFVFLGLWEGMPSAILEAMLCGLPVLTTPVGGISEIITDRENGLFVKVPIDEKDLVNKIKYFMNEADVNKMSRANIEKVKTQYDWDIIANKILDVYTEVLEGYR